MLKCQSKFLKSVVWSAPKHIPFTDANQIVNAILHGCKQRFSEILESTTIFDGFGWKHHSRRVVCPTATLLIQYMFKILDVNCDMRFKQTSVIYVQCARCCTVRCYWLLMQSAQYIRARAHTHKHTQTECGLLCCSQFINAVPFTMFHLKLCVDIFTSAFNFCSYANWGIFCCCLWLIISMWTMVSLWFV